jgi:ketosteroid isomerase-like protein
MSQENVEIIRKANDAWNRGDMDALREILDRDVVVHTTPDWPEPGPFVGPDAVIRFYRQLRDAWDADTIEEAGDYVHAADRVVARLAWNVVGHGPESRIEVTTLCSVRNGKVRSVEFFWDHDEALEAAGLRE